jgi:small subunit ribosomal protein S8
MKKQEKVINFPKTNYSVGDFLTRVKNAAMSGNKKVQFFESRKVFEIAKALLKLGFLEEAKKANGGIESSLTFKNKKPVIRDIKLISKPGLRVYMKAESISKKKGPSVYLISTPLGVLSSREAVKNRVGGEVIAEIW